MSYFIVNNLELDWIDFFVFGGYKHTSDTQEMKVTRMMMLIRFPEVVIHYLYGQEKCLIFAFI